MAFVYENISEEDIRKYKLSAKVGVGHDWVVDRKTGNFLICIHGSIGRDFPDHLEWLLAWNGRRTVIWLDGWAKYISAERYDDFNRICGPEESLRALFWLERIWMFHILQQALTVKGKSFRNCRRVVFDASFHSAYWGLLYPLFRLLRKK